ncbi:response regulator transcription factor [Paraliomyxa miuraensis]|uniref:response regulator transcription factor n=1 Tax=Paraliomyxa miuraensis TaxID=376150 RepID=UPI002259715D|nr:response regulator transcription factor [Paraliomyxa miuraensis]MCX4248112.1 response regulator transcription factor [Paraliomyxa miuraensis]
MNVLVVDDDPELCELVCTALAREQHVVTTADSLATAAKRLEAGHLDVMVLDLDLPDGSGLALCRQLRAARSLAAILILTATGDVAARVEGLDAGADDYLVKPFAVAELRARVRALGRRRERASPDTLRRGDVVLDFHVRRAHRAGLEVALTAREWAIVEILARAEGRVVPRDELLSEIWKEVSEATNASLGVLMSRIRRKLGRELIRIVRGEGHAIA